MGHSVASLESYGNVSWQYDRSGELVASSPRRFEPLPSSSARHASSSSSSDPSSITIAETASNLTVVGRAAPARSDDSDNRGGLAALAAECCAPGNNRFVAVAPPALAAEFGWRSWDGESVATAIRE